jgi:hypothetical protein
MAWPGAWRRTALYSWDAIAKRGRALIEQETMVQLDELRKELRRILGVFLDERHRYSIRAFMFKKKPRSLLLRLLNSLRSFSVGQGAPTPLILNHLLTSRP